MATVYVTHSGAGARGANGIISIATPPYRTETIISSVSTAAGALVARNTGIVTVYCESSVIANDGAAASQSAGKFCPGGMPTDLVVSEGNVVHVIDAL